MKIVSKLALAAVTTAGLAFATSAPAAAVGDHKHCLYTPSPQGYVLIAQGVSEEAPHEPTLHNFHARVHRGVPGQQLTIIAIPVDAECPEAPEGVASEE